MDKIFFRSADYKIEGLLHRQSTTRGVVITHPHPLYGGTMHNPVVETICQAYEEKGFTSLRFNFRGVGASEGRYDHGRGEKVDVTSAIGFLMEIGISSIDLAGYSFGTWVYAGFNSAKIGIQHMVMVSPPMAFLDFSKTTPDSSLRLIVSGQEDEIAPVENIIEWVAAREKQVRLEIIPGADHFFSNHLKELRSVLDSHL